MHLVVGAGVSFATVIEWKCREGPAVGKELLQLPLPNFHDQKARDKPCSIGLREYQKKEQARSHS